MSGPKIGVLRYIARPFCICTLKYRYEPSWHVNIEILIKIHQESSKAKAKTIKEAKKFLASLMVLAFVSKNIQSQDY